MESTMIVVAKVGRAQSLGCKTGSTAVCAQQNLTAKLVYDSSTAMGLPPLFAFAGDISEFLVGASSCTAGSAILGDQTEQQIVQ